MRPLVVAALLLVFGAVGPALAVEQTVAVVHAASATYAPGRAIIVRAAVDLPNSCWSNPRIVAPAHGVRPDADGVVLIRVVAESKEAPGVMCSMIFRPGVVAPALRWTHYPARGLRAVRLIGSRTPVLAALAGDDAPGR